MPIHPAALYSKIRNPSRSSITTNAKSNRLRRRQQGFELQV
ncbi:MULTISPECIES: hypothetical protein [Nocardia]|nr:MULTISPECIES: hypothetical protein [Nocardia]